jgi:U3 small nucleolar RNA-associated protein 10
LLRTSASDSADVSPNQQIISLVNFTSIALDSRQLLGKIDSARAAGLSQVDTSLSEIVRSLLDLAALPEAKSDASDSADLTAAMSDSLQSAVRLMSTKSFSEAILWLIDLADPMVRSSALGLLRTRLPSIKPARRPDISPAVIAVVDRIRESLDTPDIASAELEIALETLHVVATSVYAEEDAALAKTVPVLITVASRASIANGARSSILSIIKSLSCVENAFSLLSVWL